MIKQFITSPCCLPGQEEFLLVQWPNNDNVKKVSLFLRSCSILPVRAIATIKESYDKRLRPFLLLFLGTTVMIILQFCLKNGFIATIW